MDSSLATSLPISLIIGSNNRSRDVFFSICHSGGASPELVEGFRGRFSNFNSLRLYSPSICVFFHTKK